MVETGWESVFQEAKDAGIKVMGVPVDKQGPYDAIMHTDQYEIGTTMASMACDWIDATYPDAEDDSVEVAVIGTKGTENIKLRSEGMGAMADLARTNWFTEAFRRKALTTRWPLSASSMTPLKSPRRR